MSLVCEPVGVSLRCGTYISRLLAGPISLSTTLRPDRRVFTAETIRPYQVQGKRKRCQQHSQALLEAL